MQTNPLRIYQPECECMPRETLRATQSQKLVAEVAHAYAHCAPYRKLMDEAGVKPEDIHGIEDITKLPFTSKAVLRDNYPDGMLSVPRSEVVRVHSTSGTTGRRVIAFYTQSDIDLWEDCVARAVTAAGATKEDVCQISYGYGLFTGGLGADGGSRKVGCMTIPMSSGNTERQLQFVQDLGVTFLFATPSYAAYLGETFKTMGVSPEQNTLKAGIFGAEPWTEEMRRDIEKSLGINAYDIYGLTEISGPGVAYECYAQAGMHINEDHFYAELIDPDTGEPVGRNGRGELVFTCLDKQAFPLIRYRTRDICELIEQPCTCGRTFIRMSKPMGRSDDMMIIRGVNVFPSQIETVLLNEGYSPNYRIEVDRVNHSDTLDIYVEMPREGFSDTVREITAAEKKLAASMRTMLGIGPAVHLVPPGAIERSEGKAKRVIDRRKLHD